MRCKHIKKCPKYAKALKEKGEESVEGCYMNRAKNYYGWDRHAGCYREMEEKT